MKTSKKLLSLLLAVIMIFSVLSTAAFAWTATGDVVAGNVNVKYTVAKADSAPMADGSGTYVGDDIYAVTVWAQCDDPLAQLTATVHYNKAHYAPIMLFDGDVTYPVGAEMDQDTWYTDMAEGTNYIYSYGSYMNDTAMYKANGTTATTKALARYIGMGNSNHDGIATYSEMLSPDHPNFAKYAAGVDTDTYGIMYFSVGVQAVVKSAYFNTYHNGSTFAINKDWIDMGVVYFQRLPGVSDADCVGDTFGHTVVNGYNMDSVTDLSGTLYCTTGTTMTVPAINLVSNAVVEAPAKEESPVYGLSSQIKFNGPVAGEYAPFSIRTRAAITKTDFNKLFTDEEGAIANVAEIGFVYSASEINVADAKSVVEGTAVTGLVAKPVTYMQRTVDTKNTEDTSDDEDIYMWTCLVDEPTYEGTCHSVGYIKLNDGTVYVYDAEVATTFKNLYTQYADKIPA